MILKFLGVLDIFSALILLSLSFNANIVAIFLIFFGGILAVKSLFLFSGDLSSIIDLFSSFILFLSLFFSMPAFLLWILAFFLLQKGIVSFI